MEVKESILLPSCNDQLGLYHILKTDTFTFCLICLEDIKSTSEDVGKHLNSANHAKNIKCVFRACHPSLTDDAEDERLVDIVLKSEFDISVLLRGKTCYLCKSDNYWFCLMCEQNVTECNLGDTIVKQNIVDHVLSNSHVQKVKEVCFLYRLNDKQEFLLLNKSVVFCSVCQEVLQCKEEALLETAVVHLETKHSKHTTTNGLTSSVKQEELEVTEHCLPDGEILGDLKNIQSTELVVKVKDESFVQSRLKRESLVEIEKYTSINYSKQNNTKVEQSFFEQQSFESTCICICLCCKKILIPVSGSFVIAINDHFTSKHRDVCSQNSLVGLIDKVLIHKGLEKLQLISHYGPMKKEFRKLIRSHEVKNYEKYILKTKTDYFCIVCMVSMSCSLSYGRVLLRIFQKHFHSSHHRRCEQEKMEMRKTFIDTYRNTISQLTILQNDIKEELP